VDYRELWLCRLRELRLVYTTLVLFCWSRSLGTNSLLISTSLLSQPINYHCIVDLSPFSYASLLALYSASIDYDTNFDDKYKNTTAFRTMLHYTLSVSIKNEFLSSILPSLLAALFFPHKSTDIPHQAHSRFPKQQPRRSPQTAVPP
jgi:hypothetical protein